ncbi:ATP-binding protein [Spongiivirga sp. MCCC 1A20706]|uniref:ATP-binding protein n=1 Tax=Spongiivirga sp. MCCC 1A20706 TaxID=3160963 RepID=UPI0039776E24
MSNQNLIILNQFPTLKNIPAEQLQWLAEHIKIEVLEVDEFLFEKGSPIDNLLLIIEGSFELYQQENKSKKTFGRLDQYDISGLLPFSRATTATGYAIAKTSAKVAKLSRHLITEMIKKHYELTEVLVHEMNNRIRSITQMQVQNEKLIALGKISAGLAHELNNPASAIVRSASLLQNHLTTLPEDFKAVIQIDITPEMTDKINDFMYQKLEQKSNNLSLLAKNELEDNLEDWFSDCNLSDQYDLIPLLVEYNLSVTDLEYVKSFLREEDFNPILKWIIQNMTTQKTVTDIKEASARIEKLIKSIKSYSYMDRNLDTQLFNIHDGIEDTLTILDHKLSKKGHQVLTDFDESLPNIKGLPGELNQVWTNIIDNAIDALPNKGGILKISTKHDKNYVKVVVNDNGHGIPDDIISHIFEPFYTTKEIGKGTGLGLDIVLKVIKQHKGEINVDSTAGNTTFEICLPIE